MQDNQLEALGLQAINMFKADYRHGFALVSYYEGEGARRMRLLEDTIVEKAGEDWLNNWHLKARVFQIIRIGNMITPPAAMAHVSAANKFVFTKKGEALPPEKLQELLHGGHDRHHRAVREGYMRCIDCICANVQTPERVVAVILATGEERPTVQLRAAYAELEGSTRMF